MLAFWATLLPFDSPYLCHLRLLKCKKRRKKATPSKSDCARFGTAIPDRSKCFGVQCIGWNKFCGTKHRWHTSYGAMCAGRVHNKQVLSVRNVNCVQCQRTLDVNGFKSLESIVRLCWNMRWWWVPVGMIRCDFFTFLLFGAFITFPYEFWLVVFTCLIRSSLTSLLFSFGCVTF